MSVLGKIVVVIAALGGSAGCYAEPYYAQPGYASPAYAASYDNGGVVDTGYATDGYTTPPPEYVATVQPVYYGGRANYYYNNAWRYREGGRWGAYRGEPEGLRGYRPQRGGYAGGYASTPQRRYEGGGARGGGARGVGARGGVSRGGGGSRGRR
jgi:hypothetical protein